MENSIVTRIIEYRFTRYRIPYKRPLVTAHGISSCREGAIVELVTDDGNIGVGEIAPLPEFGYTLDDALARAHDALPWFSVKLVDLLESLTQTSADMYDIGRTPSVWFGIETAAYDLFSRLKQRSLSQCFDLPFNEAKTSIPLNAVITATTDEHASEEALRAAASGFGCIKLKVGMAGSIDAEVARIGAVRAAIGTHVHLRIDANEAWGYNQALAILRRVADHQIQYCEQPLHRDDLEGMRALRMASPVRIAADESATSFDARIRTMKAEAADILILKPQSTGSLWGTRYALQYWATKRTPTIESVITSSMETGIGVTAALHMAAATPQITLECGLATLDLLEDDLIVSAPRIENGSMLVPTSPGLSVQLDRDALARYAV